MRLDILQARIATHDIGECFQQALEVKSHRQGVQLRV